jgi:hypothetical protein
MAIMAAKSAAMALSNNNVMAKYINDNVSHQQ